MKWYWWLVIGFVVCLFVALGIIAVPPPLDSNYRSIQARDQSVEIIRACEAYRDCPANPERGTYPADLHYLVSPPFGGPSFLSDGAATLVDPWGKLFAYAVEKNENGETEVRVWTTRAKKGKQEMIGAKRHANGEIETFEVEW
jgi:hypothetical protein